MHRGRIGFLLCTALACAFAGHAFAQAGDAAVPWTDGPVAGVSLGDWTAQWWRWSQGAAIAPYLDPDGRLCDTDQSGPVWFLAGTDGTFEPRRRCVVPEGKYLLLPVINMYYAYRAPPGQRADCSQLQARAAVNNDRLVSAVVVLDGKPLGDVRMHRVRSDGCFRFDPGDASSPLAAADGYWLMLKPLPRGHHTISVGANYGAPGQAYGNMVQNFEYELDVGGRTLLGMRE
jgi:hypothetical protein